MPSRKKRARRRESGSGFLPALSIILALIAAAMIALLIRSNPLAKDENVNALPVAYPAEPNFVEQAKVTAAPLVLTVGTPQATMTPSPAPATPVAAASTPAPAAEPNRQELVAAISAAIAEDLGTDITGIHILSIKKL